MVANKSYESALRRAPSTFGDPKPGSGAHKSIAATQKAVDAAEGKPGRGSTTPKPTPMNYGMYAKK